MRKKPKDYRRLPGRHKHFVGGLNTLWQGKDHLLAVVYSFGTERYKRFYYHDIQAFILRKTPSGRIQNVVIGVIGLSFGFLALHTGEIGAGIFGILAAAMLLILLFNVWRGPTCECLVQTAVQQEKLKNFYRLKTAVKALEAIRPLVVNAQGLLAAEALQADWRAPLPPKAPLLPVSGATDRRTFNFQLALYSALLMLGLVTALLFFRQHLAIAIAETIFGLSAAALVIPALVSRSQIGSRKGLRALTWVSLGFMAGYFLCGYAVFMFIGFKHPMVFHDQWQVFKLAARLSPSSHPLLFAVNLYTSAGALILGAAGLLLLRRT